MTATAPLVQTLHRIIRQKTDLEGQLRRGPKVVAAAQAKLDAANQGAQDVKDRMTQMRLDAESKQLQMKEREDKIHQWNGQLNAAKENREYQTLKDQIAADSQANVVLSDEILEILEGLDAMEGDLKTAEEQAKLVEADFEMIKNQIAEKKANLELELARVTAELAETEKGLGSDIRDHYQRIVAAKGEDGLAAAEDGCCSGCYQSLTPQIREQLATAKSVLCPSCDCILYLARD
ncbi:MAG: phospholipase [Planctomycetota bacterium]|nr:phospholipase [Planctomycetota bacterium]